MNNRRLAKSACALGLALCLAAPAAAASYSDVPAGSWYAAAVQEVSDKGLMTGVTDTVFSPTGTVTRSTVITVLWRLDGSPAATIGERFTDVPEGAWYAAAADWAKGKGIASGNGKGAFEPDAAITREQLAVFLYNYARYKGDAVAEGVLEQYADESAILREAAAASRARWVDVQGALQAHAGEDIYYRLDHHWTSLGAYYGYAALTEAMGLDPVPLSAYEKTTVSTDFNGTTFSSSGVRWMTPDVIDQYVPEDGVEVTSWFGAEPQTGSLYDWSKLEEKDQYAFFMGGNQSLAVVRTEHTDAPKLLIVRDSYTDSLVPFLTAHFSEIHLVDPRYNKTPLSGYLAENEIDQVLVLYSAANFVSDTNLFVLSK